MKVFRVKNKIISLENVKEVTMLTSGTDTHTIIITYMTDSSSHLPATSDKTQAVVWMETIYNILRTE